MVRRSGKLAIGGGREAPRSRVVRRVVCMRRLMGCAAGTRRNGKVRRFSEVRVCSAHLEGFCWVKPRLERMARGDAVQITLFKGKHLRTLNSWKHWERGGRGKRPAAAGGLCERVAEGRVIRMPKSRVMVAGRWGSSRAGWEVGANWRTEAPGAGRRGRGAKGHGGEGHRSELRGSNATDSWPDGLQSGI